MSLQEKTDYSVDNLDEQVGDFKELLDYIDNLARHKLGYPVSLLTFLGVVDNEILGITPGSLANVLLNNVGDPFKDSETSLMEVKKHERAIIMILEKFYGLKPEEARGYVTTGGTEGNFAGLWWSKRYLVSLAIDELIKIDATLKLQAKEEQDISLALTKIPLNQYQTRAELLQKCVNQKNLMASHRTIHQQLLTPTVFFTKGHTHYSIPKISEILHLNIRPVIPKDDGGMDLIAFKKELLLHIGAHPHSSIIVIANIGTTITGAIDDVPGIKKILDELPNKPRYTIHMDGALTGFVLPILKPFGDVKNYFDAIGVNTLAVSAHKYPGLSQPCGVILVRKPFFEKAFEKSERNVDYVGNISDVTITGSRSGLNVLMLYNALRTMELHKNNNILEKMVDQNLEHSKYLYKELVKIYGLDRVSYLYHFNVMFPRPSLKLAKKYQLMLTGDNATICVLTNVTKKLIDDFINDLILEKEDTMNKTMTKTDYTITTLQDKHMKSAIELFTKAFCDSEPITKHLGITYEEYEPFVREVIQKAVNDGMSVVGVNREGKVITCTIAEDITNPFKANLGNYPKLKPVFDLLDKLSLPFLKGKRFAKNKIAHVWIAIVDPAYRGQGLSTAIDMACADVVVQKGYDFVYAEFTNPVSEKITHHYKVYQLCNSLPYDEFTSQDGKKPFKGVKGGANSYIIGVRPGVKIDSLANCYIM